jgi:ABC-type oligopeptide transport system substrate-binding subunit
MRPPRVPNRSPTVSAGRLTRRRLLGWIALVVALAGGAAFYQRTQQPQAPVPGREAETLPSIPLAPTLAATPPVTPSAPSPASTPAAPVVFYRGGIAEDPRSHDYNADEACGGAPDLFSGLVALTPDYEPVPDWAESWQSSADGRRWVFTLRRNRSGWSNGEPVRAQDFVWSWQRMLVPETEAPQAPLLFDIVNARAVHQHGVDPALLGIRALDDWSIEIELEQPRSYFPVLLGLPGLLPAHRPSVERWGEHWTEAGRCVSNGPFQLAAWEHGRSVVLQRNPYYWNNGLRIDRCVLPILAPDQALVAFFRGDLDLAPVAAESLEALVLDPVLGPLLARPVEPAIWMLVPNSQRSPFDQRAVRRALGLAIDRVRLWQLSYGAVAPARCLIPPGLAGHLEADDVLLVGQRFDPAGARRLLEGMPSADPGSWPPVTLDVPQGISHVERVLVDDLRQQLASNLQMPLALRELPAHAWEAALERGDFHLLWLRWDFPYPDPSAAYAALFERERRRIRGLGWTDPDFDSLVRLGDRETDRLRRLAIYRQCERILQEQGVYVPIGYPVSSILVKPWVRTLPRNRLGQPVGPSRLFSRFTWYVSLGERAQR